MQILDTRELEHYAKEHIAKSINIPLQSKFAIWSATALDFEKSILLVCEENTEKEAAVRLARTGLHNVRGILKGGIENWKKSGKKVEEMKNIDS